MEDTIRMDKILLGQNISKKDSNVDNFINVELSTDSHLLPISDVDKKINAYEEYIAEKDASNKHRLIFTINPICSNILFNAYSEIIYKEGSDDCKVIENGENDLSDICGVTNYCNYKNIDPKTLKKNDLIEDTSFSDSLIGFTYHCGADIFNNHILRRKNFGVINKISSGCSDDLKTKFNTLEDYLRDNNGEIIKEKILKTITKSSKIYLNNDDINMHLYQTDSILRYRETLNTKLIESDGWVGFINVAGINIPNYVSGDTAITINKCMNNNKAGEQIDMYPDRSLYSFIPKYNKYRNRMENNWDYCITYPYSSYTNHTLVTYVSSNAEGNNGIHCESIDNTSLKNTILSSVTSGYAENQILYFRTQIKNSFTTGSFINMTIFNKKNRTSYFTSYNPIKIEGVGYLGNDTNHIFAINLNDFFPIISMVGNNFLDEEGYLLKDYEIRVRKYIKGADCKYYIRKFRKLPNFKNTNVYQDGIVTEEEIKEGVKYPFNSTINKLAYGENIFSDKIAQIIFNDDINTEGLRDNLGRELSEIYLTIIKRNKGYTKWYNGKKFNDKDVEFSHCFGRIDAGVDLSPEEYDYNIHKIHTITDKATMKSQPEKISENISIDCEYFDGDIIEFSPYEVKETVLENVYHRFNTVQREITKNIFGKGIEYKEILTDDYDISTGFTVQNYILEDDNKIHLNPEGYYYQPHYRIPIIEYKDVVSQGNHRRITLLNVSKSGDTFYCNTPINYYFNTGDEIYFYEKFTHKKRIGKILTVGGNLFTEISFTVEGIDTSKDIDNHIIYKPNSEKPDSAYELEDGTGRYLWREKKSDEDMLPEDELYNEIFTNGAHYFHKNINFYLKRQDSTGEYGLSEKSFLDTITGAAEGKIKDIESIEYITENKDTTIC